MSEDTAEYGDVSEPVWTARYHVPRSQVWEGSRGRQTGNVHLQLVAPAAVTLGGSGRSVSRRAGQSLCLKRGGRWCGTNGAWYDREPEASELADQRCPRCADCAERYGVEWPSQTGSDGVSDA